MSDLERKQSSFQTMTEIIKMKAFNVMQILLKERKIGTFYSCTLMFIMFTQIIGYLFDPYNKFQWQDGYLLDVFNQVCRHIRVLPAIQESKNVFLFWTVYAFALLDITIIILLFIYFVLAENTYFTWLVSLLREILLLTFWVFLTPFMETLISIFNCENGHHVIDQSITCFEGIHILFAILSILFILLLIGITVITAMLFKETQPRREDTLSKNEDFIDIILILYRIVIAVYTTFVITYAGNWSVLCISILASALLIYYYFVFVPYFNTLVSCFWASLTCNYLWISLNTLLMMVTDLHGHIIIISIGIPVVSGVAYNLRRVLVRRLLLLNLEKVKNETDALLHIINAQQIVEEANQKGSVSITLTGIINLHILECQNFNCPCKSEVDLYDVPTNSFVKRDSKYFYSPIFIHHLIKQIYESLVTKFIDSSMLHITFACFLFDIVRNTHLALIELNTASKMKLSLQQQLMIYRKRLEIKEYIKIRDMKAKSEYKHLTNVLKFESLFENCKESIEKVVNFQVEFWAQITNQIPDLNVMHDLGKKIQTSSKEVESFWNELCEINPDYPKALTLYGNYMIEIKNHKQQGRELLERYKVDIEKGSLNEIAESSDILFSDETVIVHMSGNKETAGKILQTNQGLPKVFGYNKTEVIGHFINILMPRIFARRHTEFLERFFKTGYEAVFNIERTLFGLHRNGYCFCITVLIKLMPNFNDGVQYVGMIKQQQSEHEYIITEQRGIIDSFSFGITSLLGISTNFFKENNVNIQILAPELMKIFEASDKKKTLLKKLQESGGKNIIFIVPKELEAQGQLENKKGVQEKGSVKASVTSARKGKTPLYWTLNNIMNNHNDLNNRHITPQQLVQSLEYKKAEIRQSVKCEMNETTYGTAFKDIEPLKVKVFKICGIIRNKTGSDNELASDQYDDHNQQKFSDNNYSFDLKDSKENTLSESREIKDLMKTPASSFEEIKENQNLKTEPQEKREETKTTEKLHSNLVTTEQPMETIEEVPAPTKLKLELIPNEEKKDSTIPTKLNKNTLDQLVVKPFVKHQSFSQSDGLPGTFERFRTNSFGIEPILSELPRIIVSGKNTEVKKEGNQEVTTPRMDLGQLKGPESQMSAANLFISQDNIEETALNQPSGSFVDSYSSKDSIQHNKELVKENDEGELLQNKKSGIFLEEDTKEIINKRPSLFNKAERDPTNEKSGGSDDIKKEKNLYEAKSRVEVSPRRNFKVSSVIYDSYGGPLDKNKKNSSDAAMAFASAKNNAKRENRLSVDKKLASASFIQTGRLFKGNPRATSIGTIDLQMINKDGTLKPIDKEKKGNLNNSKPFNRYKRRILGNPDDIEIIEAMESKVTEEETKFRKSLLFYQKKKNKCEKKEITIKKEEEDEDEEDEEEEEKIDKPIYEKRLENNFAPQPSIASTVTGSIERSYYSLRSAIDEKYVPVAIRRMGNCANVVFLVMFVITFVNFFTQRKLYANIKKNVYNINSCEERVKEIIELGLSTHNLIILQANQVQREEDLTETFVNLDEASLENQISILRQQLKSQATGLKKAQVFLSLQNPTFSKEALKAINPTSMVLKSLNNSGGYVSYNYTMRQSVMELVVSAYRISEMKLEDIDDATNPTVFFLIYNSVNTILSSLDASSLAVINEIYKTKQLNITIFIILLTIASVTTLVCAIPLIILVHYVKKNNQRVLELFMYIKKQSANDELKKCKRFLSSFQTHPETEFIGEDIQEDLEEDAEVTSNDLHRIDDRIRTSKRKSKQLTQNLAITIFKLSFFIMIMEGYFIVDFFIASGFLNKVASLTDELDLLVSELPSSSMLLLSQKLAIYSKYETTIKNKNIKEYLEETYESFYNSAENLINMFSKNYDFHSESYNEAFNILIFSNACEYLENLSDNLVNCESFSQGILQKGFYSSLVKYWDSLRQINNDFSKSDKGYSAQCRYLNDNAMKNGDDMQAIYLRTAMNFLVDTFTSDIDELYDF